ncbi:hypothetical protein [Chryseobacterium luteum]|uniref:Uncharacterized protein n=1 Tax=Chryseobacterium luteum TaxID=421531 RepID=A0A085ZAY4_9FLAO|nr:hypothetical protein [Chryseobacterium luteum]KFF01598.1 hypothetical protein IX38_17325 [Chryseobacterium luteum]
MEIITAKGAHAGQLEPIKKSLISNGLLSGQDDIMNYSTGICHDVVAYALYMRGASISADELAGLRGSGWLNKFNYPAGEKWNGYSIIPKGKAIGFYRIRDKKWFHSAITTGNGAEIRSVNGFSLGTAWSVPADMKWVLGKRNPDGTFNYDGTKIEVYISSL